MKSDLKYGASVRPHFVGIAEKGEYLRPNAVEAVRKIVKKRRK